MPFIGEVKRTYSRKANKAVPITAARSNFEVQSVNKRIFELKKAPGSKNSTLNDSLWKDSFDKLLDDKP